jgi:hypothetical protein
VATSASDAARRAMVRSPNIDVPSSAAPYWALVDLTRQWSW